MSIVKLIKARKAAKAAREQGICPMCRKQVKQSITYCGECGCNLDSGVKLATAPSESE